MKRKVYITGGTRGLGKSMSLFFGERDCEVTAFYKSNLEAAKQLEVEFQEKNIIGKTVQWDLSTKAPFLLEGDPSQNLIFIHNAVHSFEPTPFRFLNWNDFEKQLEVSVKGFYFGVTEFLKPMVQAKKGTVVAIFTKAMIPKGVKGFSHYLAGKGALKGVFDCMAAEYRSLGISFVSVYPGFMNTDLTEGWNAGLKSAYTQETPLTVDAAAKKIVEGLLNLTKSGCYEEIIL